MFAFGSVWTTHAVDAMSLMAHLSRPRRGKRLLKIHAFRPVILLQFPSFKTFQRYHRIRISGEASVPFIGRACNGFAAIRFSYTGL